LNIPNLESHQKICNQFKVLQGFNYPASESICELSLVHSKEKLDGRNSINETHFSYIHLTYLSVPST